jgi:hypothetical protein
MGLCAGLVIGGGWLWRSAPLGAGVMWLVAAWLVNRPWAWAGRLRRSGEARGIRSANLVATQRDAALAGAPARVVFMAHYDTKSQLLPTGLRVGLVYAAMGICLVLAAAGVAAAVEPTPDRVSRLAAGYGPWVVVAILGVLAANVTGNRSPGALDNATGVGVLLELARSWRPSAGEPLEVVWVASGSEEAGLDGAWDFLERHESWWREKPTLLVNLDSVGAGDMVYLAGEPGSVALAEEVASRLGIGWARLRVVGAAMDHQPFAAQGLCAVSLLGDVVRHALVLHSASDRPERVEHAAMRRAGLLAEGVARAWAARYQRPGRSGSGLSPNTESEIGSRDPGITAYA